MKTKVNRQNKKYWISLSAVWIVSAAALAGCYYVLHLPQKEQLTQVHHQYTESQDMVLIANKATSPDVRDQIDQRFQETGKTLAHFAVPQDNTTGLVFEIGKIANELGLSEFASKNQKTPSISTLGKDAGVTEVWLEVEFQSSFQKFAEFVNRLERQNPAVFIEQMTIRRNDDGRQDIDVNLELSFLVRQGQDNSVAFANTTAN